VCKNKTLVLLQITLRWGTCLNLSIAGLHSAIVKSGNHFQPMMRARAGIGSASAPCFSTYAIGTLIPYYYSESL
jgi:hypothetical protein